MELLVLHPIVERLVAILLSILLLEGGLSWLLVDHEGGSVGRDVHLGQVLLFLLSQLMFPLEQSLFVFSHSLCLLMIQTHGQFGDHFILLLDLLDEFFSLYCETISAAAALGESSLAPASLALWLGVFQGLLGVSQRLLVHELLEL